MAIITISRQIGSFGNEIAKKATDRLNYSLMDINSINEMVSEYSSDFSKEMIALADENRPGFFDRFFYQQSVYSNLISALIYDAASKDNIIVVGRGGQFLLRNQPSVIHIRIIAPFELRVSRVKDRQKLKPELAEDMVRKIDRQRADFIRYLFQANISEPEWYDMIINTGKFDVESTTDILVNKARMLDKTGEDTINSFKILALQKRVEATLQKEMPDSNHIKVKADIDGTVTMSGYIATDVEKNEASKHAESIQGVNKIENLIQVAYFPVTTWP
ncbi:MAG: cytidylate kinase family protein [Deltaproteobacteria bacterium]|nr:cytidylate kinase family protein [Deltaproteobacteria bacterium]MBW2219493.1 cytidylate kinase family protein [Deltaproteobacteria bacterium]